MLMLLVVPRGLTVGWADVEPVETGAVGCWVVGWIGLGLGVAGNGALPVVVADIGCEVCVGADARVCASPCETGCCAGLFCGI